MKWQPIETAPDKTPILVTDGNTVIATFLDVCGNDPKHMYAQGFSGREWDYDFTINQATHWMPLPEPPEVEKMSGYCPNCGQAGCNGVCDNWPDWALPTPADAHGNATCKVCGYVQSPSFSACPWPEPILRAFYLETENGNHLPRFHLRWFHRISDVQHQGAEGNLPRLLLAVDAGVHHRVLFLIRRSG